MKSSDDQIRQALKALFTLPARNLSGSEREVIAVYLLAVDGIPAGFVAMACKRFIQGQVQRPNLQFRPEAPELAVEARRLRDKALDHERLATLRLPKPESKDPPDPTPEERERAAARWAEARAKIAEAVSASTMPKKTAKRPTPQSHLGPAAGGPTVDIADFPPANATTAELKAWDARQNAGAAGQQEAAE